MTKASGDDGVRRVERWPEAEAGENKKEGKENLVEETTFDLTLRSHGHIRVETLSWIEVIRRKHGFGNDSTYGLPPAGVGRTASAKDRISLWMESSESETESETK